MDGTWGRQHFLPCWRDIARFDDGRYLFADCLIRDACRFQSLAPTGSSNFCVKGSMILALVWIRGISGFRFLRHPPNSHGWEVWCSDIERVKILSLVSGLICLPP